MRTKEELELTIREQEKIWSGVRRKLNVLKEELKDLVEMPRREAMVGRFFRYEDRYTKEDGDEPWYVYVKVVRTREGYRELETVSFMKNSDGEIEVDLHDYASVNSLLAENAEEITEDFFLLHWQLIENEMSGTIKEVR